MKWWWLLYQYSAFKCFNMLNETVFNFLVSLNDFVTDLECVQLIFIGRQFLHPPPELYCYRVWDTGSQSIPSSASLLTTVTSLGPWRWIFAVDWRLSSVCFTCDYDYQAYSLIRVFLYPTISSSTDAQRSVVVLLLQIHRLVWYGEFTWFWFFLTLQICGEYSMLTF